MLGRQEGMNRARNTKTREKGRGTFEWCLVSRATGGWSVPEWGSGDKTCADSHNAGCGAPIGEIHRKEHERAKGCGLKEYERNKRRTRVALVVVVCDDQARARGDSVSGDQFPTRIFSVDLL